MGNKCPLKVGDIVRWGRYDKLRTIPNMPDSVRITSIIPERSGGGWGVNISPIDSDENLVCFPITHAWFLDDKGRPVYDPFLNEVAKCRG